MLFFTKTNLFIFVITIYLEVDQIHTTMENSLSSHSAITL